MRSNIARSFNKKTLAHYVHGIVSWLLAGGGKSSSGLGLFAIFFRVKLSILHSFRCFQGGLEKNHFSTLTPYVLRAGAKKSFPHSLRSESFR